MPNSRSIVTTFEEVVSRYPRFCALRWAGGSWSYTELNARANRLAYYLINSGVRAETPVGVFALRSPETMVALLAILKAGGAYVPLEPSHPPDRLNYYLEDAAIQLVLTDSKENSRLPRFSGRTAPLDWTLAMNQAQNNPDCKTRPDSLAHVLYTSGSTGHPKGVLIEHRGVLRLTQFIDYMEIGPGETFLQYAPLSFDISTFEIWATWLNGACLALAPAGMTSLHELGASIRSLQVSCMTLTASLMAVMVDQEIDSLAGVRQLLTGGDVVSPAHAERFLRKYPDHRMINAYGPTENSVLTSCHRIRLEDPMPTRLSIGRPIQKTEVLILNEKLEAVPPGEVGEMVMTGEGVARGYLNQPELTDLSFVEVVDSSGNKVRGYRSGDLGRYNADGTLDFRGRTDDQVKINGIRIEPGEIKNILQAHPRVAAAEVILVENAGQKHLEIFASLLPGTDVEERALREFLRSKIPGNWLPSVVRIVPHLPLNPNGKVDRRALLESLPPTLGSNDSGLEDQPQDTLEKAIWAIWRDILPDTRISVHDHFSDLSGDSLSALDMMARVEKVVGRPIGMRALLEGGTIMDIAAAARESSPVTPPDMMINIQTHGSKPPFFFAHGDYVVGGLYCQKMAHKLGASQPVYAIAPHGTFGENLPASFEEAAASYVKLIRSVQPKGPYHLGGFCNGAVAMYEVAQMLIREGETVATLVLLDPPDLYFFLLRRRITRLGKFVGLSERLGRNTYQRIAEGVEIWQYYGFLKLAGDFRKRIIRWALKNLKSFFEFKKSDSEPSTPNLNFHYYEVMANYEPKAYLGSNPAWIILRKGESLRCPRQISYWNGLIPHAHFEMIPGNHLELTHSMGEIAGVIQTALTNAPEPNAERADISTGTLPPKAA